MESFVKEPNMDDPAGDPGSESGSESEHDDDDTRDVLFPGASKTDDKFVGED